MLSALPRAVVALRMRIFARINGEKGIPIPGPLVGIDNFREVYSHPAANGRSKGAALSDLFWYWLAPGPQVHQEHLEPGPRYAEVARTTRRFLARPKAEIEELVRRCTQGVLDELPGRPIVEVRLRELMMPIWAEVFYELVFGEPCPRQARELIVDNARDVINSLKCVSLRHLKKRERLTGYLIEHLDETLHPLPKSLSRQEQAWYLQGAFFNTAIVQMSEAMTHLMLAVAKYSHIQERVRREPLFSPYEENVLQESLRCWPLFGIAHRITSDDIVLEDVKLATGSVVCFSYPDFHAAGFDRPEAFDPDRWERLDPKEVNHIPFGITANRACPARGVAPVSMQVAMREVLARFELASAATHSRPIPNRGPCLLIDRSHRPDEAAVQGELARMARHDRREEVWRSLVQLGLGTYMVLDARRKRMAARYFEMRTT